MVILRSIVNHFDAAFNNAQTLPIWNGLNEKEKMAVKLIQEENTLSDSQLKRKLLKEIYNSKRSNSTYRSFISTLESKFLNIASLAIYDGTELENTRATIRKESLAFYHLEIMGLDKAATKHGISLYKKAIKFQCYYTARNIIEFLEMQFCVFGNSKDEEIRRRLKIDYETVQRACMLEKQSFYKFGEILRILKDRELKESELKYFNDWITEIEKELPTGSAKLHYFYFQIQLKLNKGTKYKEWCENALVYFENLYFKHDRAIHIFRRRLLHYQFENGDTSINTIRLLDKLRSNTKQYSDDWFSYSHSLVKIYLNIGDISSSWKIIDKVFRSSKIKYIPASHRNEWKLIRMYWKLTSGKYDEVNIRKIRHSLTQSAIEKSSENIPFLIGEILYFLKVGELDQDRKINHLRKVMKEKCEGDELQRGIEFCNALQNGRKYSVKRSNTSFKTEYVFYEKLLEIV